MTIIPEHGKRTQRRCLIFPWPVWWDAKQNPAGVLDLGAHCPAGWPGSIGSGKDPCESVPGFVPTGRSNRKHKDIDTNRFVIMPPLQIRYTCPLNIP